MTLTQLRALASEPDSGPFRLQRFTREDARELLREVLSLDRKQRVCECCGELFEFDLSAWLSAPSRLNPLAAAAAVKMMKENAR